MSRKALIAFGAAVALTAPVIAETISPADIVFDEYGVVETSLTGMAGDPEKGRAVMNKGAGNCIACHQV